MSQTHLKESVPPAQVTRDLAGVRETVTSVIADIRTRGDEGVTAWRDHGQIIVVSGIDEAFEVAGSFAFEHVEVLTSVPRDALARVRNFGALFLGEGACVSYGGKVIGTSHVLPTRGAARHTGGLWVGMYLKTVTCQEVRDPVASARLGQLRPGVAGRTVRGARPLRRHPRRPGRRPPAGLAR
jgi:sulfopropanediol 3-dehydrogenase